MPYIGHSPTQAGSYIEVDDFGSSFNGSNVAFTLQVGGVNITPNQQNLLVMIDGVLQQPSNAFSVSGSTITFTEAPANGADLYCLLMGQSASIGNGTIGADELKISGDGTSGQLLKSDGDGTYSYLNQNSVTAGTATTLATARTINGVSFDGSANITVTADANTLSNTTLKSTVVNSSLTSVGTLTGLTTSGNVGVGASASFKFDVQDNSTTWAARVLNTNAGGQALLVRTDATNDATALGVYANGAYRLLVTETASTFSNKVTIASAGVNASPNLAIDNSSSSSYIHSIEALGANMSAGQTNIINLGKIGDAKNSGVIGYKWNGAGSNDNLLTFEHWGTGPLVTMNGLGAVGMGSTTPGKVNGTDRTGGGDTGILHLQGTVPRIIFDDNGDTPQFAITAQDFFTVDKVPDDSSSESQLFKIESDGDTTFAGGTTTFPEGGIIKFGERGNLTHNSSNYNMSFNTNSVSNAVVITGTGLLQAKRGFTAGQALDIEGETFGRTNGSSYAFGYRQDHASGGLMKLQKGATDVFLMTNSGRIAQTISEGSAYAATFENTSSGGYGLRVYGGASWADNALLVNDHNGNEAFAVKANGITVSDGKVRQAYVSATYPQNSTTTRTFNIMTLLGHSAGTPYGLVEFLFHIYTNGGNTDSEVHRVTLGGYMHTGYSQDLAWNLVHEVLDAGSTNSAISSITLTGTGGNLNIAYSNGDSNDDAYLRGIMRGWGA